MKHNHRLILSITMIIFVVIIAIILASFNFFEYKKQVENNETLQLTQIEDRVENALTTLNKAYILLNEDTTEEMKEKSRILVERYEQGDQFENWDFDELSKELEMDLYIIDEENKVIHSNVVTDIGLDFTVCCQKLIPFLTSVRQEGLFTTPGIDIEQATNLIKKFSYEGTKDGKFIIELGYAVHNDEVFGTFNFLQDIDSLYQEYSLIQNLRVLNIGSLALGGNDEKLSEKRRKAFDETLETKKTTEVIDKWEGVEATYRYVYYEPEHDEYHSFGKITEIVYDHQKTKKTVSKSFRSLIIQLLIVFTIIVLISLIIHFWVAQHVYSAQHDNLTDLKNRSMFDETLKITLEDKESLHALMMIDLDNFKVVNDTLGHLKGDQVLQIVAKTLKSVINSVDESSSVYRVGGDEFTIIMPRTNEQNIIKMAEEVNKALHRSLQAYEEYKNLNVSASIGIARNHAGEHVDTQTLYKEADYALYKCKQSGKNGYCLYEENMG